MLPFSLWESTFPIPPPIDLVQRFRSNDSILLLRYEGLTGLSIGFTLGDLNELRSAEAAVGL